MISCTQTKEAPLVFTDFIEPMKKWGKDSFTVEEFRKLRKQEGPYFDYWMNEVADLGRLSKLYGFNDSLIAGGLTYFVHVNFENGVYQALEKSKWNDESVKSEIRKAFGGFSQVFPKAELPIICSYISMFSDYTTFAARAKGKVYIGYSAEMFLGDTFSLYKTFKVPIFYNRYNAPSYLPIQLVQAHMHFLFETYYKENHMLDLAVYNGKLWAFLSMIFPNKEPWELFGYSKEEWKLMERQEGEIWRHYLNEQVLYQTDRNKFTRYFVEGEKTFGPGIPDNCPPRIGKFTGYKIVKAYLDKTNATAEELLKEKSSEKILRQAAYNPIK